MRWSRRASLAGVALVLSAGVARAHEVGATRFDAPLPLAGLYAGAGLTVAVTAGWLAVRDARAASDTDAVAAPTHAASARRRLATLPPAPSRALRATARVLFLLAFVGALLAGAAGRQVAAENLATVLVWPVWLAGVGLAAMLFGSPWRVLSPWRSVYDGLCRLEGEVVAVRGEYPEWLGHWPASAGYVAWLGLVANATTVPRSPRATAALLAGYAGVMVLGAVAYGESWFRRADALEVLYRLFGRVAPFPVSRTADGSFELAVRAPWRAPAAPVADGALAAFVVGAVYTVSFDGFTETPAFQDLAVALATVEGPDPVATVGLYAVGLAAFLGVFWAVARLGERAGVGASAVADGGDAGGGDADSDETGGAGDGSAAVLAFAPTLLPIAAAYEFAHAYPWVLANAGRLPTAVGGLAGVHLHAVDPLWWLTLPAFWASQVVLIVGGHVAAVVAAHVVCVRRYGPGLASTRAHVPLTALMVGYTVLSLWIVSRPVVA